MPPYLAELRRLVLLLRRGFTLPIGQLSRWTEDAVLIVDDELAKQEKPEGERL